MTVQERRAGIKQYIISLNGKAVGKKAICEAVKYPASGDFAGDMNSILAEGSGITVVGVGRARAYMYSPVKELYSEVKNPEGYKDFTAGKAIANALRSSGLNNGGRYPMRQQFGEVWQFSLPNGSMEGMLVVAAKNGSCICVPVYPTKQGYMDQSATICWLDEKKEMHFAYLMNLQSRAERDLKKKLMDLPEDAKEKLLKKCSEVLGLKPETIEVEKIVEKPVEVIKEVEKIVEKPVEVIKEVPVPVTSADPREMELALLRQRVEIYEQFLRGEFVGIA